MLPGSSSSHQSMSQRADINQDAQPTAADDGEHPPAPQVHVNGKPARDSTSPAPPRPKSSASSVSQPAEGADASGWGANFWVTLADPQTGVSFYACPATGEVSWDPPVGNFLLPPSPDGEWWEMTDEASGLPYYYQTKTGETVWDRPQAFVIPLSILQNTALARRLSLTKHSPTSPRSAATTSDGSPNGSKSGYSRSRSNGGSPSSTTSLSPQPQGSPVRPRAYSTSRAIHSSNSSPGSSKSSRQVIRRSVSGEKHRQNSSPAGSSISPLAYERGHPLAPIPGSPYTTDNSPPGSPSRKSAARVSTSSKHGREKDREKEKDAAAGPSVGLGLHTNGASLRDSPRRKSTAPLPSNGHNGLTRSRSSKSSKSASGVPYRAPQPQSLNAALEKLAMTDSPAKDKQKAGTMLSANAPKPARHSTSFGRASGLGALRRSSTEPPTAGAGSVVNDTGTVANGHSHASHSTTTSTSTSASALMGKSKSDPGSHAQNSTHGHTSAKSGIIGREISSPVFDAEATQKMSPVKMRNAGRPILVEQPAKDREPLESPWNKELGAYANRKRASLNTGTYPVLPDDLQSDIQQFSESQFARQYFSTHRTGFLFRRTVPVEQMMTWQKSPLNAPLLQLNKPLYKEAIKTFKSIQRVMGDRGDKPHNGSTTSLQSTIQSNALLEEERSLLSEGLTHGELRDEVYCQVMKQLSGNPNPESVFKGWQLLCVLLVTFPPSKNFEPSLRHFLQRASHQPEGRVDVMAKYCLRRLEYISRKGPRGKPPALAEIESASDAAFHPSIFGESLDVIFRLQERTYPQQQVPIILPFLSDGILALGGTKSEGIFRVPGDGDAVSELKLRIDKGYYTLNGFDDPNVLASLLKLWLRELADPLIPDELYNDCITESQEPDACVAIIRRLPTANRRVVLFVVSFLQLFLEEKIQVITKMTAPNLALVMAPNLLRCNSESMAVVFTNAQYEQTFVHNLLLYLKCDEIDPDYIPVHGRGAIPSPAPPIPLTKSRSSKSRHRTTNNP